MELWAKTWPHCNFLCLCTAGDDDHKLSGEGEGSYATSNSLASRMASQSGLQHACNGIVAAPESLQSPFSQLGCSGFIVLDAEHNVVCPKTSAYLTCKKYAFLHVDALLDATTSGVPPPRVCPGELVTLERLASSSTTGYNGSRALCLASGDRNKSPTVTEDLMKVAVQPSGKCIWVPKNCLVRDDEKTEQGSAKGCDCGDDAPLKPMQSLATVQMPSLDAEHEECVKAVNALVKSSSIEDLKTVHACFNQHFSHEEDLMQQAGFGGGDPRFCARTSHAKDHARIISYIEECINSASSSGVVPVLAIRQVMSELADHAEKYDDHYVECLSKHSFPPEETAGYSTEEHLEHPAPSSCGPGMS